MALCNAGPLAAGRERRGIRLATERLGLPRRVRHRVLPTTFSPRSLAAALDARSRPGCEPRARGAAPVRWFWWRRSAARCPGFGSRPPFLEKETVSLRRAVPRSCHRAERQRDGASRPAARHGPAPPHDAQVGQYDSLGRGGQRGRRGRRRPGLTPRAAATSLTRDAVGGRWLGPDGSGQPPHVRAAAGEGWGRCRFPLPRSPLFWAEAGGGRWRGAARRERAGPGRLCGRRVSQRWPHRPPGGAAGARRVRAAAADKGPVLSGA